MKINSFISILALGFSLLIAFGFYSFAANYGFLLGVGSLLLSFFTLFFMLGAQLDYKRGINVKVASGLFFIAALISNLIFSFIDFSIAAYIITQGILLLLYLLVAYTLLKPRSI